MKANRPASLYPVIVATAFAALLASCASPPPSSTQHTPRPGPTHTPTPQRIEPPLGWRDVPITPGNWRWSRSSGASSARFAEGPNGAALEFRCDRATGAVSLIRAGAAAERVSLIVTTTSTARALSAQPLAGPQPAIVVSLPARDPLLDAIVFSRGRFAVEARGFAPIFVPTWPEIARVVEDCR